MLRKPLYCSLLFGPDKGDNPPAPNPAPAPTPNPETPPAPGTPPNQGEKPDVSMTQAEFDAKMAAARRDGKAAADQAIADAKAKADADALLADQEAKGKYEDAKKSYESTIADKDARIAELESKVAKAEESAAKRVETLKAELPDEAMGGFPADAEATVQEAWLVERADLVSKLAPAAGQPQYPRVPPTPPPGGPVKPDIRENLKNSGIRYT